MATTTPSTAYSRDLGDELRRLRESCTKFSGLAFAARLGWDQSKVSTIETGKYRASELDLMQYVTACGKDNDFFEEFKQRYRFAFEEYIVQMSDNLRTLVTAESTAKMITGYYGRAVPGLVQTPGYADGIYRIAGFVTEERIPALVDLRIGRQAILRRHYRPTCLFYVHEHVLQNRVADDSIMEEQYLKLLFNAHMIRIVPASAPVTTSDCMLFEYEKSMPVAFVDTDLAKVFVQDPGAIVRTRLIFDRLAEVALDAEQSRSKLAEYVSRPREDLDDSGPDLA